MFVDHALSDYGYIGNDFRIIDYEAPPDEDWEFADNQEHYVNSLSSLPSGEVVYLGELNRYGNKQWRRININSGSPSKIKLAPIWATEGSSVTRTKTFLVNDEEGNNDDTD